MEYKVQQYICLEITVNTDTAEDALAIAKNSYIDGTLVAFEGFGAEAKALAIDWWVSDAIGATVTDSEGDTVLEDY